MGLVADDQLVGLAREGVDVPREPRVRLDRDRVLAERLAVAQHRVVKAVAVALRRQVARELVHEQAPVREDEHAHGLRRLDEAGGGDRLPGGRGVAEAEAPDCARVVPRRDGFGDLLFVRVLVRAGLLEVFLLVVRALLELHGVPVAVAVPVLRFVLVPGDQLGQHPGERVDLVAAQLRSRREPGRAVRQHALEAEHERVVHLPLGRRGAPAGVHLEECSVERTPACVALGEHVSGAFAGVEDGLP